MDVNVISVPKWKERSAVGLIILWIAMLILIILINYDGTNITEGIIGLSIIAIPMTIYIYISIYLKYVSQKGKIYIHDGILKINKLWKHGKSNDEWYEIPYENIKEIGMTNTNSFLKNELYYILTENQLFLIDSNYPIKREGQKHISSFHKIWNNQLKKQKNLVREVK